MISTFSPRARYSGRDDQLDHAALGVRGRQGQVDLVGHGDGLGLARIDHRQAQVQGGDQRRGDAGNLGGEDARGADGGEEAGKFRPQASIRTRVDLVVDETIHFEDAVAQNLPFALRYAPSVPAFDLPVSGFSVWTILHGIKKMIRDSEQLYIHENSNASRNTYPPTWGP